MSVLAMFVGLCGVWMAGDARRRAEGQTIQFVRSQVTVLRKGIEDVGGLVVALDSRLKAAERKLASLESKRGELDGLREDLAIMRSAVGALQEVRTSPEARSSGLTH